MDGNNYVELICEACKVKVVEEFSNLKTRDKLRPKRVMKKAVNWVCDECRKKIEARLLKK